MLDPLAQLLASEPCQPLLAGLRRRAEQGRPLVGKIRLNQLSAAQRHAIADLSGQSASGARMAFDIDAFAKLVERTGRFESLRELVERAVGRPIENKAAVRRQHADTWTQLWQWADKRAASDPATLAWLAELRGSGWLKQRARRNAELARELLAAAFDLQPSLPAGGVPLSVFAAMHLGDAHALDVPSDLGRLVCRMIARLHGLPPPLTRRDVRRAWESAGIVLDELSVTVLALNLPAVGDSLVDDMLQVHARRGEPCRLHFRHLRLHPPCLDAPHGQTLYVCENPSVVAVAAERLGVHCRPLVCVEGQPNLAAWRLLSLATHAGWPLAYHGDFDWGGLRIANQIYRQFGFTPWRFDTANYIVPAGRHRKLGPVTVEALWDSRLGSAMAATGRALDEEQVLGPLLADLDARGHG